jgi:hypothetical protein
VEMQIDHPGRLVNVTEAARGLCETGPVRRCPLIEIARHI